MGVKSLRLIGAGLGMILLAAVILLTRSPASLYRLTGSQRQFNIAVSRYVPKGATLGQLEAVVARGTRTPVPSWLRRTIRREPDRFREGWREGDDCVSYAFPGNSRWYFQVRDGRLVNYDPVVLADQPQEKIAMVRPLR
jgi:hypothetical protein